MRGGRQAMKKIWSGAAALAAAVGVICAAIPGAGADCFYEAFDPENKDFSPYGSDMVNSYCHAWSGTPAYFIRKYF